MPSTKTGNRVVFVCVSVALVATFFLFEKTPDMEEAETVDTLSAITVVPQTLNEKKVPTRYLTLNDSTAEEIQRIDKTSLKNNLYGKFFNERIEFYIVENPTNRVHSSAVNHLTIYYLDGKLCKTRSILDRDIVNRLIQTHGGFKIRGMDKPDREILKTKDIVSKTAGEVRLNKELRNYQISWNLKDQLITYEVLSTDSTVQYAYMEKIHGYEEEFDLIEKAGY